VDVGHFLDLGTSWMWVVSFTPRPLYTRGKSPRYPLDRRLAGPQRRSGQLEKEKILHPTGTRNTAPTLSASSYPTSLKCILILFFCFDQGVPSRFFPTCICHLLRCQPHITTHLDSPFKHRTASEQNIFWCWHLSSYIWIQITCRPKSVLKECEVFHWKHSLAFFSSCLCSENLENCDYHFACVPKRHDAWKKWRTAWCVLINVGIGDFY
jgi:hypothetical protein